VLGAGGLRTVDAREPSTRAPTLGAPARPNELYGRGRATGPDKLRVFLSTEGGS
jgi:hypothetical protein